MIQRILRRPILLVLLQLSIYPVAAAQYSGKAGWAHKATLSMPVNGVVSQIKVSPGARVAQGELMLSLDQRYFDTGLASAKAALSRLAPGRDEARRELDRAEELFERTVLSQVELDRARMDFAEKSAMYQEAEAAYQRARLDKEYSELKAPFALVVIRVLVVPGQTVVNQLQATPMLEVAAADQLLISFDAKMDDASSLRLGGLVQVGDESRHAKAKVVALNPVPGKNSVQVQLVLDRKSMPGLRVGENVKVQW